MRKCFASSKSLHNYYPLGAHRMFLEDRNKALVTFALSFLLRVSHRVGLRSRPRLGEVEDQNQKVLSALA